MKILISKDSDKAKIILEGEEIMDATNFDEDLPAPGNDPGLLLSLELSHIIIEKETLSGATSAFSLATLLNLYTKV